MECDVIILGGGVAGAAAAQLLAAKGVRVVLLEQYVASRWKIGETLAPEARTILQKLKVWEEFVSAGHLPCHGIVSAWGSDNATTRDFIFNPHGNAWQLDRAAFEEMLLAKAVGAGAQLLRGNLVESVVRLDERWRVAWGGTAVSAPWLVDATGQRALAVKKTGTARQVLDALVAIYAVADSSSSRGLDQEQDLDSRTFIESCLDGWWYTALTPRGRRTISFQTDADLLPGQEWRSPEWLRDRLKGTRHLSRLIDPTSCRFVAPPRLISAHTGRLDAFSGRGWLAVGDAAMSFDPLSGQGLLKALQSGALAAEVITEGSCDHGNYNSATQARFDETHEKLWQQYSAGRLSYYAMDRRWIHHAFWKRRQRSLQQVRGTRGAEWNRANETRAY